ncbi:MAG: ATP-dependent protease, partial [Anaerolineales bacterium]
MVEVKDLELGPEQLRVESDPSLFSFKSTGELQPLDRVIGQERAVRAIDFGVDMPSFGYNIFAAGLPGSGRTTAVRQFLGRRARERPVPPDWCYVYNFGDPRRPRAVSLPPGRGIELRDKMDELVRHLQLEIPRAFEGEFFEERRREINLGLQQKQQELLRDLETYLNQRGFALVRTQMGLGIVPMLEGKVLSPEEYEKLDAETKSKLESSRPELQEQYDRTMRQTRELDRTGKQAIDSITQELAGFVVDQALDDLEQSYSDCPKVSAYLDAVRSDVVQHASDFMRTSEEEKSPFPMARARGERQPDRYKVNVLTEKGDCVCAPVIIEDNPTYHNLVGRIEHRAVLGAMVTDFTQIRAGALHRANGGYLVVEAKNLLANPSAWDGLKRALRNREIKIEEMAQFYGLVLTATLEPEAIPLDVKVVIIGDARLYQLLFALDEDFRELFKVKAEFATTMPRDRQGCLDYAALVGDVCREEGLGHFAPSAVARIIDQAARLASDQQKVTTRFADVADLVREAAFWAQRADHELVLADDVSRAIDERTYRLNRAAERYVETIQEGVILIDTDGEAVGQVNGLSVVQLANFEFGLPSRVTAKTFAGRAGVVSIERQVKMSGPIHDKGQLILASCLASRFAQKKRLGMSASLTFEQLYSGVEGDSASTTELYALLSSLSEVPIKQSLAVTGSVNQFGQVQAIGGANAKIEGFFDVCKARGLTGEQGVLIPRSNVRHLMLRDDVVEAVAEAKFHIYGVSTIEEGIELLTGKPAGEVDESGDYPEGSVYALVQAKLDRFAEAMERRREEREEEEEGQGEEEEADSSGGDSQEKC